MLPIFAVAALIAASPGDEEPKWELKAETRGVTVHQRARKGCDIRELRSVGQVDAPPEVVFRIITDFDHYKDVMPYTKESKIQEVEKPDGKVKAWIFYTVIDAPLVSRRDYTLRVVDASDWRDGKGYLKTEFAVSEKGPAEKKDVVRVKVVDGSWLLEPLENGSKTRVTYTLFTDPGGSLPAWISNKANSSALPDLFESLRKHSKDPRYTVAP